MPKKIQSHTVEDYLKAIFVLQAQWGRAKTSALAVQLGITAGSVTSMLHRLSKTTPHLITYQMHQGAILTARGRKAALDVIRRHRLLETFLHDVLKLDWNEVHAEAEVLEHHLSARVVDAIDRLLDCPQFDPHGEPIPSPRGNLPAASRLKLANALTGDVVRVVRVQPHQRGLLPYLDSLGIGVDSIVEVLAKDPLDGPITLRLIRAGQSRDFTVGRNTADLIYVTPADRADA